MSSELLVVLARITEILEGLNIPYFVGGSLASSLYGVPRATNDVDLAAAVRPIHVRPLAEAMGKDFYVSEEMIADAVRDRGSFNVIHLATMFKADVFVLDDREWSRQQLKRSRKETIPAGGENKTVSFATPEDTILQKLIWYSKGGEVSDQQWKDIQGVLKVQGASLDFDYMNRLAGDLGVTDLLQRARESVL